MATSRKHQQVVPVPPTHDQVEARWRECLERSDAMEAWEDSRPSLIDHPLTAELYVRGKCTGYQRVDPACLDDSHLEAIREYEAAEDEMVSAAPEAFVRFSRALRMLSSEMTCPTRKDVRGNPLVPFL
jgi:hypothetical protein